MSSILLFIAVLVGLIVVHEFGHFIVAKRAGIRVDEFGLFFGPRLFKKRFGETDYTINLWPIGGFVRIFGENPDEVEDADTDRSRAFFSKPWYVQAAVLVAGVSFNVLAAWFLFSVAFMVGVPANATEGQRAIENARLTIVSVLPDSPASLASLRPGDVIVGLSAPEIALSELTPEAAASFIRDHGSRSLTITYERSSVVHTVSVMPEQSVIEGEAERAAIGISMGLIGTLKLPLHLALVEGFTRTIALTGAVAVGIFAFLGDALTLQADFSQVAGPVGIVSLVGDAAELGVVSLLTFAAIISLHLAVINLLPIPALDGGRLLFVLVEAIKGSPIRPSVTATVNAAGFALLILLMVAVTYNDILRLVL
jgi:regulator of sigma E protease